MNRVKSTVFVVGCGSAVYCGYSFLTGNKKFYATIIKASRFIDGESSHKLAVFLAKWRLFPACQKTNTSILKTVVWGQEFDSPIGLAAGFDKHAEAMGGMFDVGFSFVEVGSVTPQPQPGNPKPRVFRLEQDLAVVNRYGLNSVGHDVVLARLNAWQQEGQRRGWVGVNLAKNTQSENKLEDYAAGVRKFAESADYIVINVSCPNVKSGDLSREADQLETLVDAAVKEMDLLGERRPLLLKISPDLTPEQQGRIAIMVLKNKGKINGLIIGNTTTKRPEELKSRYRGEQGGLSGKPLGKTSTEAVSEMYLLTRGQVPIVGCGGVSSGKDAYEKIRAGASLVQLYTAMVFFGPPVVCSIRQELADCLRRDGFASVGDAVGADHNKTTNFK